MQAFGVWVFTLKQNQFYMELRLSTSYERYFFGVIGFHPKAIKILYGASVIKVTTRNVVIYDESFMTFLNSVTIAHNSRQFSDFRHEFEGMGPRPKT